MAAVCRRAATERKIGMTRRGKIARLPKGIRDELNGRLQNGEAGVGTEFRRK